MRKCISFLILVFLLSACQPKDSDTITLNQIVTVFENEQVPIKEAKASRSIVFGTTLNGTRPKSYVLEDKNVFIYIYGSSNQREKGLEDFVKRTEAYDVVSYQVYEVKNVLIFYVHEQYLSEEIPYHDQIQKVITNLE